MTTRLARADEGAAEVVNTIPSSTADPSIDLADGNVVLLTLDDSPTLTFTGQLPSGRAARFTLYLIQDGTGSRTVTWPGSVVWPGGTAPTLTTAAAAVDRVVFESPDQGTTWYGTGVELNFS